MKKVILLEDDADLTEIIEIIITSEHYDLLTLSNAGNIIKQITDFAPDVVILDVLSSGADGRLICRELKSNEQLKHIPVMLFSALHNLEQLAKDCAADAFLEKPFNVEDLLCKLRQLTAATTAEQT